MYETHRDLESLPEDDCLIWRYISLAKLVSMLKDEVLYFSHIKLLRDKHEGMLTQPIVEAQKKAAKNSPKFPIDLLPEDLQEQLRSRPSAASPLWDYAYVNCWHQNEHESAAMWDLYAQEEGVAIRSTIGRFKDSFTQASEPIFIAPVKYIDFTTKTMQFTNALHPIFYKRKSFAHENEIRAITASVFIQELEENRLNPTDPGLTIKVDLESLIDSIYIKPDTPKWIIDVVHTIMVKFKLGKVPIKQSDLFESPIY